MFSVGPLPAIGGKRRQNSLPSLTFEPRSHRPSLLGHVGEEEGGIKDSTLHRIREKRRLKKRSSNLDKADIVDTLMSDRRNSNFSQSRFDRNFVTSVSRDDDVFSNSYRRNSILKSLAAMNGTLSQNQLRDSLGDDETAAAVASGSRMRFGRSSFSIDGRDVMLSRGSVRDDGDWFNFSARRNFLRRQQRARPIAKFRRVARLVTVLFGLWRKHATKVKVYMEQNIEVLDVNQPNDLLFDKTLFRADKEDHISDDCKRILSKRPEDRTEDEVKYIQIAFGNYHCLAEYPNRMKRLIAERSWIGRYEEKRVVIRQGHVSRSYYIILTGSVTVSCMDEQGVSRTLCFLGRGENFGELGIINKALRSATVITREPVELLIIHEEDYIDIFMSGGLGNPEDTFIQSLAILNGWPIELLVNNTHNAFQSYFKRGIVLVFDNILCDWIIIVKSGSCDVLKKLRNVQPISAREEKHRKKKALTEEQHNKIINNQMEKAEAKVIASNSESFRNRMLRDLGLGIPLKNNAGSHHHDVIQDSRLESRIEESSQVDHHEDNKPNELFKFERETTKMVPLAQLPIITMSEAQSSDTEKVLSDEKPTDETPNDHKKGSTLTVTTLQKLADGENKDLSSGLKSWLSRDKTVTTMKSMKSTDSKKKKVVADKKTIVEQINEQYLRSVDEQELLTDPVFVKIQTLGKRGIFGLTELFYEDQPHLVLVSNGAECVLIRKKFYIDNMSRDMKTKLARELSPLPSDDQLQSSLQVYIDWLQARDQSVNEALKTCAARHAERKQLPFFS